MRTGGLRTFDATVRAYAAPAHDLAVARILYAGFILVSVVPVALWLPLAPRASFNPPIGLAALFTTQPPSCMLQTLNVALAVFAAMLLVGWRTSLASAGTGLTLLFLDSWAYSLGKINHDILLVIAPLLLGPAGWGQALSVDSRHRAPASGEETQEWPVALFALLVGFAMWTAGWAKAMTGWLNPRLLCTYGHLAGNYWITGRETWLAERALAVDSSWLWKGADWAAVGLELSLLPAVLNRRAFGVMLAIAALFHLGIMLLFGISFPENILAYAAFVRYPQPPRIRVHLAVPFLIALALGSGAIFLGRPLSSALRVPVDQSVVWLGAAAGGWYLFQTLRRRFKTV